MKALIIGAGIISKVHCDALAFHNVIVSGIYDVRLEAAQALAQQVSAKAYDDLDAALNSDIDFAVICTPSGTHADLAIRVMEAGKDVVVEKPLALTAEDCDSILDTVQKTGKVCAPISQLRFSPAFRAVKACIDRHSLGTLVMSSLSMKDHRPAEYYAGTWKGSKKLDGGELMNQGIHGIDIMCGLLGKPTAISGKVITRYHEIEAEDTAVAHLSFPSGMLGTIDSSTAVNGLKPRRLEICGTSGLVVMENDRVVLAEGLDIELSEPQKSRDGWHVAPNLHTLSYRNIIATMNGSEPLEYTAQEAADTVRVICAIYESSETGKCVYL